MRFRVRRPDAGPLWRGLANAALVLAWAVAWPGTAGAQDMAAHAEAGHAFEALRAAHPDRMPRLADAEAAPLLRTLSDASRFLPEGGNADLPTVSDTCDRAQSAAVAYLAFGAMQQGQLSVAVVAQNAVAYQDELALVQPFVARCIARQVPLAEAMLRQLDPRTVAQLRLGGLKRGQASVLQVYAGLATALPEPRFQPAYIDALLDALAETAAVHVRALPVASRDVPLALANEQAAKPGPRQARWQRIRAAMSDTRCQALCELASRGGR